MSTVTANIESVLQEERIFPPPPIPLHDSSTDPSDFTGPYVLLASREQSGPITGQAIEVDGGIGVRGFAKAAGGDHL